MKYNCIWIMCDQLRSQALSCNGDPNVRTPNLDLLAKQGINFKNAVGGYPLCCPYRGSMLTGLYPHNCTPGHEYPLPMDKTTIADIFNDNGYHTAYVGKWHLDGFKERNGRAAKHIIPKERRGHFDYWLGYENNNSQWDCYVHGHDLQNEIPLTRLGDYETNSLTDLFIDHLSTVSEDTPFFGVLSVQPPHDPYIAPPEFMKSYTPGTITMRDNVPNVAWVEEQARKDLSGAYAMIENLDYNIGRLVQWLRETGRLDNTHILFFSDHGDMHGSHGMFRKTVPYEESIKVPFIISGCQPFYEEWHTGESIYPINHVDIAPTSLGLCCIEVPKHMQGTDYSSVRMHKETKGFPDSAYLQSVTPVMYHDCEPYAWRGILTNDGYKYVAFENMPWLMFDLNTDPYEQVNLAHNLKFSHKREALQARLQQWIDETGDHFQL